MNRKIHVLLALLTGALLYGEITVRQCPPMISTVAVPGEYSQTFEITNQEAKPAEVQLELAVKQQTMWHSHNSTEPQQRMVVRKTIAANATDTITAACMVCPPLSDFSYRQATQDKIVLDYSLSVHAIVRANGKQLYETSNHDGTPADVFVSGEYHTNGKYSLVSRKLADKLWHHGRHPDEVIIPAVPPSQWSTRSAAYIAYSSVMLDEQEELPQAVEDALLLYVQRGGTLVYQSDSQSLMKREKHGLGTLLHLANGTAQLVSMGDSALAWQHLQGYQQPPEVEHPTPPVRMYAIILVVAILLLGPGVWFWMSWRKKTLQSLWLTPVLSIITCLLTLCVYVCHEGTSVRGTIRSIGFYDQLTGQLTVDAAFSTYIPIGSTELKLAPDDLVGLADGAEEESLCDESGKHVSGAVRTRTVSHYWVNGQRKLTADKPLQILAVQKNDDRTMTVKNLSGQAYAEIFLKDGQNCYGYNAQAGQNKPVMPGETVTLNQGSSDDRYLADGRFRLTMVDQPIFGDVAGLSFDTLKGSQILYGRWK